MPTTLPPVISLASDLKNRALMSKKTQAVLLVLSKENIPPNEGRILSFSSEKRTFKNRYDGGLEPHRYFNQITS